MSGLRGKCGARCGSRRAGSVGGYLREKVERLRKGGGMVFTRPMVWDMVFCDGRGVCAFYYRFIGYEEMRCRK